MLRSSIVGLLVGLCVISMAAAQPAPGPEVAPDPMGAPVPYPPPQPYGLYAPGAPPPPAYAPGAFVPHSQAIRVRMDEVRRERARLIQEGRPANWLERRVGGIVGLSLGAATLGTVLALAAMPGLGPHSDSERSFSRTEAVAYPIAATFGAALFGIGIWAFTTANGFNPHQDRIDALHDEYEHLTRDYKTERRREKLERRGYSVLPSVRREHASATRFMLVLSTTL
ncbi:MAG: hypothetical protein ABW352_15500 [Polyangiales bacterium]